MECTITKSAVAVTASNTKTYAQIKAVGQPARPLWLEAGFDGVTPTDVPILLELLFQTSAGTPAGSLTPQIVDGRIAATYATASAVPTTTASYGVFSAEPSSGAILWSAMLHPQLSRPFKLPKIVVAAGVWLGLRLTAGALTTTTHVAFTLGFDE